MRVVVTGATGNVGTSVVSALAADPNVTEIVGLARRAPDWDAPKTRSPSPRTSRAPRSPTCSRAPTRSSTSPG